MPGIMQKLVPSLAASGRLTCIASCTRTTSLGITAPPIRNTTSSTFYNPNLLRSHTTTTTTSSSPTSSTPTPMSTLSPTSQPQTYAANCHCGTIKYSVTLPQPLESQTIMSCNCSICTRNGYLLVYPLRKDVVFHQGESTMKSYFCGKKERPHRFCGECGSSLMVDFMQHGQGEKDFLGVNARMFKDLEVAGLTLKYGNGRDGLEPKYEV